MCIITIIIDVLDAALEVHVQLVGHPAVHHLRRVFRIEYFIL